MPDAAINYTADGWPYLDANNYVDVLDEYTVALKDKLTRKEQELVPGTGWTTLTGGWTARVARVGKTVFLSGIVTPAASPGLTVAPLPAWAEPRQHTLRFPAIAGGNFALGHLEITQAADAIRYTASLWSATPSGGIWLATTYEALN